MAGEYKPRFIFEISEEQQKRAAKVFTTQGLRRAIFSRILDDVMDLIEEEGGPAIGILLTGKLKPRDMLPSLHQAKGEDDGND